MPVLLAPRRPQHLAPASANCSHDANYTLHRVHKVCVGSARAATCGRELATCLPTTAADQVQRRLAASGGLPPVPDTGRRQHDSELSRAALRGLMMEQERESVNATTLFSPRKRALGR
ncbi:hypothetical protein JYU34_019146 [Plutella xylostella]|uniref:Uncharacterized protein n=1 Tax=Plutella xylostella TaxID=51655 RepID=A0ABQ7PW65_PLUXY|nr:hypothetical protein JYU34_019146 [Plutella xylostella]